MLKDIINEIISEEELPRGLNEEELSLLKEEVKFKMHYDLPEEYLALLSEVNCPCFNGFYIYGKVNDDILDNFSMLETCDFLIMNNEFSYEENGDKYIIFGESTFDYCAYSKIDNCYVHLDMGTGEIMDTFTSFNDMAEAFLIQAIN